MTTWWKEEIENLSKHSGVLFWFFPFLIVRVRWSIWAEPIWREPQWVQRWWWRETSSEMRSIVWPHGAMEWISGCHHWPWPMEWWKHWARRAKLWRASMAIWWHSMHHRMLWILCEHKTWEFIIFLGFCINLMPIDLPESWFEWFEVVVVDPVSHSFYVIGVGPPCCCYLIDDRHVIFRDVCHSHAVCHETLIRIGHLLSDVCGRVSPKHVYHSVRVPSASFQDVFEHGVGVFDRLLVWHRQSMECKVLHRTTMKMNHRMVCVQGVDSV